VIENAVTSLSRVSMPRGVLCVWVVFGCTGVLNAQGVLSSPVCKDGLKGFATAHKAFPTSAELLFATNAKRGQPTDLTSANGPISTRIIRNEFLRSLMNELAESSNSKAQAVVLDGAYVCTAEANGGPVVSLGNKVPFRLIFRRCDFADEVSVKDTRFEQSLELDSCNFNKGLTLEDVSIKGDLLLNNNTAKSDDALKSFFVNRTTVEGRVEISNGTPPSPEFAPVLSMESLKTRDLYVRAIGRLSMLSLKDLNVDSLRVISGFDAKIEEFDMTGGHIRDDVYVRDLAFGSVRAQRIEIGGEVLFSETSIAKELDLSFAKMNSFRWGTGASAFPKTISLAGATFRNLLITQRAHVEASGAQDRDWTYPPSPDESFVSALNMLGRASYSSSAYDGFEQLCTNRGQAQWASKVFLAGRHKRRLSDVRLGEPLTWLRFISDFFQEYVLGYGRIPMWPILWSIATVCVGFYMFRKSGDMEAKNDRPVKYSSVWYSIELFLPIIDLGVAKDWRPSQWSKHLATYARLHQLAGWVLIPVTLAALAGFVR
jgi:hypothetical protein